MEIHFLNQLLSEGTVHEKGQFPYLERLEKAPYRFQMHFGLEELPKEEGILVIRGARQYGKSTWLQQEIKKTIQTFGPGTAFYLNGEYLIHVDELEKEIETLTQVFTKNTPVKRLFIDEITAIANWELALKRLADRGVLRDVLVVTTGSKATDLRRASERLPGRKGKLARTNYLFTPISYTEFHRVCSKVLGPDTLIAYLLSGGSPIACGELATHGAIPEYVIELTRDWVEGEISKSGRSRAALLNIFNTLFRYGGTPVGQAKLAREAGLANNTVAAGYIELLNDLGCVVPAYPMDVNKKILILRKPCKYHFTNLLVAVSYHSQQIRSIRDFLNLPEVEQGKWYEWLVAEELLRCSSLVSADILSPLAFWQSKDHEIDFVPKKGPWIEVKRGRSSPLHFNWFIRMFPNQDLTVINTVSFRTEHIGGMTLENFLRDFSRVF